MARPGLIFSNFIRKIPPFIDVIIKQGVAMIFPALAIVCVTQKIFHEYHSKPPITEKSAVARVKAKMMRIAY